MALFAGHSMAQGVARVTNSVYGIYDATTLLTISIGGTPIGPFNSSELFISRFEDNLGSSATAVAAPLLISESSAGNAITSPYSVTLDLRAGTTWGTNKTYASISGFEDYRTTSAATLCATVPGSGTCLPGPEQTQTFSTYNRVFGQAQSRWEEIYQTGGAGGTLGTTFNVHVSLGPQPGAAGATPSGSASFSWAEKDFLGNTIASFSASYYAPTDSWWAQTFSNATGLSQYLTGEGSLAVGNGAVLVSSLDGSTFDGVLTGTRSFATDGVVYVDSFAASSVDYGSNLADAENTVTLTNLSVPTGVRLLAQSGTNYSGVFTGGGDGGGLCTDLTCLGGGGGGTPPIPEPGTYALLLAGLGVVGWSVRRRRTA